MSQQPESESKVLGSIDLNNPNDDLLLGANVRGDQALPMVAGTHRLGNNRRSSILKLTEPIGLCGGDMLSRRNSRRVSWAQTFQYKEVLSDGTTVLTSQELNKYGPVISTTVNDLNFPERNENVLSQTTDNKKRSLDSLNQLSSTKNNVQSAIATISSSTENVQKIKNKFCEQRLPQVLSKYYNPKGDEKDYATVVNTALNKYGIKIDHQNPKNNLTRLIDILMHENPSQEQNLTAFLRHFNLEKPIATDCQQQSISEKTDQQKVKQKPTKSLNYTTIACEDEDDSDIAGSNESKCEPTNSTKLSDEHTLTDLWMISQSPIKDCDQVDLDDDDDDDDNQVNDAKNLSNGNDESNQVQRTVHDTTFMNISNTNVEENDKPEHGQNENVGDFLSNLKHLVESNSLNVTKLSSTTCNVSKVADVPLIHESAIRLDVDFTSSSEDSSMVIDHSITNDEPIAINTEEIENSMTTSDAIANDFSIFKDETLAQEQAKIIQQPKKTEQVLCFNNVSQKENQELIPSSIKQSSIDIEKMALNEQNNISVAISNEKVVEVGNFLQMLQEQLPTTTMDISINVDDENVIDAKKTLSKEFSGKCQEPETGNFSIILDESSDKIDIFSIVSNNKKNLASTFMLEQRGPVSPFTIPLDTNIVPSIDDIKEFEEKQNSESTKQPKHLSDKFLEQLKYNSGGFIVANENKQPKDLDIITFSTSVLPTVNGQSELKSFTIHSIQKEENSNQKPVHSLVRMLDETKFEQQEKESLQSIIGTKNLTNILSTVEMTNIIDNQSNVREMGPKLDTNARKSSVFVNPNDSGSSSGSNDTMITENLTQNFRTDLNAFTTDLNYSLADEHFRKVPVCGDLKVDIFEISRQIDSSKNDIEYVPTRPLLLGKSATQILFDVEEQETHEESRDKLKDNADKNKALESIQRTNQQKQKEDDADEQNSSNGSLKSKLRHDDDDHHSNYQENSLEPFSKLIKVDKQPQQTGKPIVEPSTLAQINLKLKSFAPSAPADVTRPGTRIPILEPFKKHSLLNCSVQKTSTITKTDIIQSSFRVSLAPPKLNDNFLKPQIINTNNRMFSSTMAELTTEPVKSIIEIANEQQNKDHDDDDSMGSFFRTTTNKFYIQKSLGLTLRDRLLEKIGKQQNQIKQQVDTLSESIDQSIKLSKQEDNGNKTLEKIVNSVEKSLTKNEALEDSLEDEVDATMDSTNDNNCVDIVPERILSPIEMEHSIVNMLSIGDEVKENDNGGNCEDEIYEQSIPIDNFEGQTQNETINKNNINENDQTFNNTTLNDITRDFTVWMENNCMFDDDDDPIENLNYSVWNKLNIDQSSTLGCLILKRKRDRIPTELRPIFDFLKRMDFRRLNVRIQSISKNMLVLRYLFSTLELRIHFGSIVKPRFPFKQNEQNDALSEIREIVAMDLISLIETEKPLCEDLLKGKGQKHEPLFDGDSFLLTFRNEHRPFLHLAHDYVLTHFEEKRPILEKQYQDTSKLEQLIKEFSILVTPAKKLATELRVLMSKENLQILPKNQDGRFGISVEILALNEPIELCLYFDHLNYPDEVIHPNIIVPDNERYLYPLEEFAAALKMIKPCRYNYITRLLNGSRFFILALRKVLKQNKLQRQQNAQLKQMSRFELQRS